MPLSAAMTTNFSDLVIRAKTNVALVKMNKDMRDAAVFEIGWYISDLRKGSLITLRDGRIASAPAIASPAAICNMTFSGNGLEVCRSFCEFPVSLPLN